MKMTAFKHRKTGQWWMGYDKGGAIQWASDNARMYKFDANWNPMGTLKSHPHLLECDLVEFEVQELGVFEFRIGSAPKEPERIEA